MGLGEVGRPALGKKHVSNTSSACCKDAHFLCLSTANPACAFV